MENSAATPYPVFFFDGEQDIDIGNVGIHSSLGFKMFQGLLAQKIGYPPQQISVVLVCRKSFKSPKKRQKLPINDRTNFALILSQHNPNREDCFFHVISKKPRKERKGRARRDFEDDESRSSRDDVSPPPLFSENTKKHIPAKVLPQKTLLRRDPTVTSFPLLKPAFQSNLSSSPPPPPPLLQPQSIDYWYQLGRSGQISPFYSQLSVPERFLHMQENGHSFQNYQNQAFSNLYSGAEETFMISRGRDRICELCSGSKERPVPFHFCVYDTITSGFRGPSPAGPIERPAKGHMGSAAPGHIKAAA